jgi:HlyD family secretion protein
MNAHHVHCEGRVLARLLLLVVIVAVAAGAWGVSRMNGSDASDAPAAADAAPASPDWYDVERRSFDLTVAASGELEAKRKVEVKCEVEGQTTIVEVIPEGSAVAEGDVLVKLADDKITEKIVTEQLQVEQATADLIAAQQELAIAQSDAENELKEGQLKVELAELDLEKWRNGTDPQKQRELQLALERATRELKRAKEDLVLSRELEAEKFISTAELEDDELEVIEADAALLTANLAIEVYEQYTRPKELKQVESDLEQAHAALERTRRRNESKLAQAEAKLKGKQRTLQLREDRLAEYEEQLAKTVITAPQDGLVVYASSIGPAWRRRGDPIAQGRQVQFNESIIVLPDTRDMVAKLKVHEAMVAQVKVGMPVNITIDARPDEPMTGQVDSIGVMAEDGGWLNPNLREYDVTASLPTQIGDELKPAMRCTGVIQLGRVEDALAVPMQAVHAEGKEHYCFVRDRAGRAERRTVTIGRAGETFVEITEGLEAGDRVLLRNPRPQELARPS